MKIFSTTHRLARRFGLGLAAIVLGLTGSIAPILNSNNTAQAVTLPPTVSADPLPTAQIDGVVWAQVIVGNTVYATGHFHTARPAGVPLNGAGTVTRNGLVAYDITTGKLASFAHQLTFDSTPQNGGQDIQVSPDHKRLYVGGTFSAVDGNTTHANFAAFDLSAGGKLMPGFTGVNRRVSSIAATNTAVYFGGNFDKVGSLSRTRLAAFNSSGGNTAWAPTANASVQAMIMTPDNSKVVIGGPFTQINGKTYYGMGAISATSPGTALPWASQSATYQIRDVDTVHGSGASITSFSKNANTIFLTAFNSISGSMKGGFEGRAGISPADGHIIFMNDCHGDSYSAYPIGNVLYSVSHAHDCEPAGAFPEVTPRYNWHALAETITPNGVNGPGTHGYWDHRGAPKSDQLDWYPILKSGDYTGQGQAAWSVTGNANYIALGGEFPSANGMAQQGLVRYAIRSLAANKIGPKAFGSYPIAVGAKDANGHPAITITGTSDPDDMTLTYKVYRGTGTTPIYTVNTGGFFYKPAVIKFTDTGTTSAGNKYRVTASDPYGNTVSSTGTIVNDSNQAVSYTGTGWTYEANMSPYIRHVLGNDIHFTTVNGRYATMGFNGTSIKLFTEQSNRRGKMSISIDGGAPVTVDAYIATSAGKTGVPIFTKTGLAAGNHTIKVTKVDGDYMVIDGFQVDSEL